MRIIADTTRCVGAGQCVLTEPDVFDQDDEGTVALLVEQPEERDLAKVREATDLCPGQALSLVEE